MRVGTGAAGGAGAGAILGAIDSTETGVGAVVGAGLGAIGGTAQALWQKRRVRAARRDLEHALETSASGYRIAEVIRAHPHVQWNRRHIMSIVPREDHMYVLTALDASTNAQEHTRTRNTVRFGF